MVKMYEKYDLVFTKDGIEIRKGFDDPLLGKDVRIKRIPYKELDVLKKLIRELRPIIEDISVDELSENDISNGIGTLKIEIGIYSIEDKSKNEDKVSNERIERAIIKILGDNGGALKRPLVHKKVYQIIDEFKNPYYHEIEPNGYKRWIHRVDTVKETLKREGHLKKPSESGRGIWALTEKGWDYYKVIK